MAKFKSGLHAVKDSKGNILREVRVWLPLTDEGLLEPIVDDAVVAGALLKKDGTPYTQSELETTRAELRLALRAKEVEALKKRKPY